MRKITLLVLGVALLAAHDLTAQGASAAARSFLNAQTEKQWTVMAGFADSTSLLAMRKTADKLVATLGAAQSPAVRARMDSLGMSQALNGIQSMLGAGSMLPFVFARVTSAEELKALSDLELMARWLEVKSFGYMMELSKAGPMKKMMEGNPAMAEVQREMERMQSARQSWAVVGETAEGDSVAHVVFRAAGNGPPAPTGVITFRKTGGRWLLHFTNPDDQLAQLGAMGMRAIQTLAERLQ